MMSYHSKGVGMMQMRQKDTYVDNDLFEIMVKEHSDVFQRMTFREYKEKVTIVSMAMGFARWVLDETDKCHPQSPIERLVWMYLARWISQQDDSHRYNLIVQHHVPDTGNGDRFIDLVVQYVGDVGSLSVAIECDGREHLKPHVAEKDALKDQILWEEYGVETVRLPGIRIFNDEEYCVQKVVRALARAEQMRREGYIH